MSGKAEKVAIVMPVWRQASFADEAISSLFSQQGEVDWHLIIVNDGCPDRETGYALEAWRLRAQHKITVLTQENDGLAAARNAGIEYALRELTVSGIFFLDADNRLDPTALQLFNTLLSAQPDHDWYYPNFDMFGLDESQGHGGEWSLSRMAISNMCDAGSLVRRHVFEAGVRFAPELRNGFEDWDFWLSAAKLGFCGYAVPVAFFRYRKRGQSMLSAAHAQERAVLQSLRVRHKWLFGKGRLAEIYAQEWPRFAFVNQDGSAEFGDFPSRNALAAQDVERHWFAGRAEPFESRMPQTWVFGSPEAFAFLRQAKRLGSVLLELEASNADGHIGIVRCKESDSVALEPLMRHSDKGWEGIADAALISLPARHIEYALQGQDLMERMTRLMSHGTISPLGVFAPNPVGFATQAVEAAASFVARLSESDYNCPEIANASGWRKPASIASPRNLFTETRALNHGGLHLPGQIRSGKDIGFVLPILRFGGVEKCVVALAGALRSLGATPHLFLYGDQAAQAESWLSASFKTIHQITRKELRDWSGKRYMGTADGRAPSHWLAGRVFGPLTAMDAVINAGCGPINSGVGDLRRSGVKTVTWEHLVEETDFGRLSGTPYLALSNEAAYDLVLTCSQRLADWITGFAVSRDKLLPLPNGPGFPDIRTHRAPRDARLPLRVGFMGRLDRQKGVDRFVEIATALKGPPFAFSLVGAAVVEADDIALPDWIERFPLARTPKELSEAYARLDVLLMPSRAEGLPLAVLEAQRAGVVPVISDVGAVSEAVTDGVNGILLNPQSLVGDGIVALKRLAQDRALLHQLASAPVPEDRWAENAAKLLAALGLAPLA
ncbi:MAG: glycosyltransferase [Paracoccaceae bacterium]